ncbi:UBP3-associated protein BRE5 [Candida viswanathii]|uniref:UBP3-associated protein BRE5 n=1 Tax=Candida viswanathii TaxID=5486 RepID=A0A367XX29_9ASCO|nr:UBP3-associated protein BRE5 [Candida viswanathii]
MATSTSNSPAQANSAAPGGATAAQPPAATPSSTATPTPTPAKQQQQQLSDERVSEIGWYFIKSYYDFFVSKLDEIHKIYHPLACISHDSFPEHDSSSLSSLNDTAGKIPVAYKARGIDAIKETYAKYLSSSKNNRIVITSACFQLSLNQNIIIVVFGEWSTNDQPYKQFTQTFVLARGKNEANYEVANDILRFVVVNGYKEKHEQKQEKEIKSENVAKKSATPVPAAAAATTTTTTPVEPQQTPAKEQEAVANNVKAAQKDESVAAPVANGSKEETKKETATPSPAVAPSETKKPEEKQPAKPEPVKEEAKPVTSTEPKEEVKETKEDAKPEAKSEETKEEKKEQPAAEEPKKEAAKPSPTQPMSWAALAQQAVPAKQTTKPISSPPITKTTSASVKKPASSASSASTTNSTQSNGKYKKDDWYPIYIRGIRNLDEQELKEHLSKKFGELKYFKVNENICLADFVIQDAQRRALEAKETTLKGVVISLEPRESKTGHNFHGTAGNNGSYKKYGGSGQGGKPGAKNKEKFENSKKVNGGGSGSGSGKKNINKPAAK